MTKFVFKLEQKGWFNALGLHHASIALIPASFGLLLSYFGYSQVGSFIASGGLWYYLGREYKEHELRRGGFEIMDFTSPAVTSILSLSAILYLI